MSLIDLFCRAILATNDAADTAETTKEAFSARVSRAPVFPKAPRGSVGAALRVGGTQVKLGAGRPLK